MARATEREVKSTRLRTAAIAVALICALPASASAVTLDNASVLNVLSSILQTFSRMLANMPQQSAPAPESVAAGGNYAAPFASAQRIDNLTNVTVSGVTGLTASDIPSLSYLPLSGGTVTGDLTVSGAFSGGSLSLSVASTSNLVATNATSSSLFSTLGHFTTGIIDTLTATAATITNLLVTTITGTSATFTNATTTNATSTNLYVSNLNLGTSLAVANGGTGAQTFGQGWVYSNGGTGALAASTSPTVNYITATSTVATSSFAGPVLFGPRDGSQLTVKDDSTGSVSPIEWAHNGTSAYIIHLTGASGMTGSGGSGGALMGLGVNYGGVGLFVNNYLSGVGVKITNRSTTSGASSWGLLLSQSSNIAAGMYLSQETNTAKELVQFASAPIGSIGGTGATAAQKLTTWYRSQAATADTLLASMAVDGMTYNVPVTVNQEVTAQVLHSQATGAYVDIYDTGGTVNSRRFYLKQNSGSFLVQARNDDGSNKGTILQIDQSGNITQTGGAKFGGSVGIGTTTPYGLLSISNSVTTAANTPLFVIASTTGGTATTTVFSVANTGNVTIVGSAATCTLGNGSSATSCSSSDQRLKDEVATIDASSSLAAVESLRPVSFKWNQWMVGNGAATSTQFGFIAQEIMSTFPNLVTLDSNSHYYKLDYQGLFAPLVGAIQALAQQVEGFAVSFTTKELTFTRATGDEITVRKANIQQANVQELCVGSTCLTESQVQALLNLAGQQPSPPSTPAPSGSSDASSTLDGIDAPSMVPDQPIATSTTL